MLPLLLGFLAACVAPLAAQQRPAEPAVASREETTAGQQTEPAAVRRKVLIRSTIDDTEQPCYVTAPGGLTAAHEPAPLLVSLHSWSGDVQQRNAGLQQLEDLAVQRGWVHLFPHFRGANQHPDACGSEKAQQDILDAIAWAQNEYPVDRRRIYLTGSSGGGHMTLLMAGRHPDVWAAASAWVGISDLAAWHASHADARYGAMLRACCGGAPGDGPEVDQQYRVRSPLTHLHRAARVPLDIAAGIHDGHSGSVPIRHSLDAFNCLARALDAEAVSEQEIQQLSRRQGRLDDPQPSDRIADPVLGRGIHLRRRAGPARVTIFEGGHESVPAAAIAWLEQHRKPE
jgi:dipeptidyl aminopeptidase/acylaminoacyl peptidase